MRTEQIGWGTYKFVAASGRGYVGYIARCGWMLALASEGKLLSEIPLEIRGEVGQEDLDLAATVICKIEVVKWIAEVRDQPKALEHLEVAA